MNYKANRQKFYDALRSGDYSQVRYEMKSAEGAYCAIGLCALVAHGSKFFDADTLKTWQNKYTYTEVYSWLNFITYVDTFAGDILWQMNDSGKSFTQIADWLENNEAKYFDLANEPKELPRSLTEMLNVKELVNS